MNSIKIKKLIVKNEKNEILRVDNLDINSGDYVLIDGYNGQGKSILLKIISGDIIFEENILYTGSVKINGEEILGNYNSLEIRKKICYIPQDDDLFTEKTVFDEFYLAFKLRLGINNRKDIIEIFEKNRIPKMSPGFMDLLDKDPKKLSGGNKRLISVLLNLLSSKEAKIFLIDEPLNNLDVKHVKMVSNMLNRILKEDKEKILLMVSHYKVFPFINREVFVENNRLSPNLNGKKNIIGSYDECGFYKL